MKILDVHVYPDGGTKLIVTDQGKFWIPADKKKILYKRRAFPGGFKNRGNQFRFD